MRQSFLFHIDTYCGTAPSIAVRKDTSSRKLLGIEQQSDRLIKITASCVIVACFTVGRRLTRLVLHVGAEQHPTVSLEVTVAENLFTNFRNME